MDICISHVHDMPVFILNNLIKPGIYVNNTSVSCYQLYWHTMHCTPYKNRWIYSCMYVCIYGPGCTIIIDM